jgi:aminoglycoside phosphotransferase (APT) family kinase protein
VAAPGYPVAAAPGNLLCTEGRLSAVLDGAPVVGDPAVELAAAYQLFDAADRRTFRETRPEVAERSSRAIAAVLAE